MKKLISREKLIVIGKSLAWMSASVLMFYVGSVFAQAAGGGGGSGGSLGALASRVTGSFANVAKLITAGAYVAGMGFAVGAVMKFKAHKDNPTQIPVGTPIALLFIATALIFLPEVFKVAGVTLFGSDIDVAGAKGTAVIPGLGGGSGK